MADKLRKHSIMRLEPGMLFWFEQDLLMVAHDPTSTSGYWPVVTVRGDQPGLIQHFHTSMMIDAGSLVGQMSEYGLERR